MWLWLCFWTGLEWVDQQLRHENNNNNIVPQQSSLWKVTRVYVVLFSSGHSIYSCVCNQEFGSEKRRGGGQAFKKPAIPQTHETTTVGQKTVIWFLFVDHQSFPWIHGHTALVDFFSVHVYSASQATTNNNNVCANLPTDQYMCARMLLWWP